MMKDFSQWAGPVEDLGEEFDKIDENGGGQVVTIIVLLASILTRLVCLSLRMIIIHIWSKADCQFHMIAPHPTPPDPF